MLQPVFMAMSFVSPVVSPLPLLNIGLWSKKGCITISFRWALAFWIDVLASNPGPIYFLGTPGQHWQTGAMAYCNGLPFAVARKYRAAGAISNAGKSCIVNNSVLEHYTAPHWMDLPREKRIVGRGSGAPPASGTPPPPLGAGAVAAPVDCPEKSPIQVSLTGWEAFLIYPIRSNRRQHGEQQTY